jgi:hypothetical protein
MSNSLSATSRFSRAFSYFGSLRTAHRIPVHRLVHGPPAMKGHLRHPSDRATSAIGVPFARASSACLSFATTSSGR